MLCSFLHPEDTINPKVQLWLQREKTKVKISSVSPVQWSLLLIMGLTQSLKNTSCFSR